MFCGGRGRFAVQRPDHGDVSNKMPGARTVAVVTDIAEAREAASIYGIPAFDLDDVAALADFIQGHYARRA